MPTTKRLTKTDWFVSNNQDLGELYEKKSVKDHSYFVYVKTSNFIRFAQTYFGDLKEKSCLDIGCGTGETTLFLSKEFKKVVGLDYAHTMLKYGQRKEINHKISFITGNAGQLPLKKNTFDVVVLFNILHHVNSKETLTNILFEAKNSTKDNGIIAIIEMNPFNPITRHIIKTCEIDKGIFLDGFKQKSFPTTLFPNETNKLLSDTGLKVIKQSFFVYTPRILKFLLPLEKFLQKVPLGGLYMIVGKKEVLIK